MAMWWREPDMGVPAGEQQGCAAARMWRHACGSLCAPDADRAWNQILEASAPDDTWHSLRNCIAYQAGVWQSMVNRGISEVQQPAAFKLALVLRHSPLQLARALLTDLLKEHPQTQDLTSYILALLTDDESRSSESDDPAGVEGEGAGGGAPLRDSQLFEDCELAVLAASKEEYDTHARLVRAEYTKLSQASYAELRIKILNQFSKIPKLYHTPEFEPLEASARENIQNEIRTLRENLLTGFPDTHPEC